MVNWRGLRSHLIFAPVTEVCYSPAMSERPSETTANSADPSAWTTASAAWTRFFHATERPDALALIRITLCAALLVGVLQRLPHARELVSTDGAAAPHYPVLDAWVPGGTLAVVLYAVLATALVAGLGGWQTRIALLTAAVLLPYLGLLDGLSSLTKYTIIGWHGLVILAAGPSGAAWSIDARFGRGQASVPVWPRRLVQLLLCVLYFATAITKVRTAAYHSGEHLTFWMLTDLNAAHPLGHWLATRPTLAIIASQIALVWEAMFCVLVWVRPLRRGVLAVGAAFHIGTFLLLGLWLFPLVMLALYPAFADADRARRWMLAAAASLPRPRLAGLRPLASPTGLAVVTAIVAVTAIEAEYRIDPMDIRHPDRRPAAPQLSIEEAAKVLTPTGPLDVADWVYRADVGTTMAAGVVQSQSALGEGESPTLQVWVHQPHPDFVLQTDVVRVGGQDRAAGKGQTLTESSVIVLREMRSAVHTIVPAVPLPPGRYAVSLKTGGREFRRVRFDVR